ncbi:hypothetical protein [Novipirellula caenicola]|uniref:RNA polymerase sigma factor n=1 Tax=Novipirellula caenicola TaxID=1536901 RepID=A0ABP9VYB6_9BACT
MSFPFPSQFATSPACRVDADPNAHCQSLADDAFTQTVIRRKVRQLLTYPEFAQHEAEDIHQELQTRLEEAMRLHDDDVGHRNPYITMIVDRQASHLLKFRRWKTRADLGTSSLNVMIESGGEYRELLQCVSDDDRRRRLETAELSETDLVDMRNDLSVVIAKLPDEWQRFMKLRLNHSVAECSRIMNVPRSTLKSWLPKIAEIFQEEGLRDYIV